MAKKQEGDVLTEALEAFRSLSAVDQQAYIKQLQDVAGEKREAEIADLKARLAALGVTIEPPRAARGPRKVSEGGRAAPRISHRGPNGETWTSRGRVPSWGALYGATTREEMEKFRIVDNE